MDAELHDYTLDVYAKRLGRALNALGLLLMGWGGYMMSLESSASRETSHEVCDLFEPMDPILLTEYASR